MMQQTRMNYPGVNYEQIQFRRHEQISPCSFFQSFIGIHLLVGHYYLFFMQ